MNSNQTISVESDENEVDELYKGGTSESHSYDELASPTGLLRLSGRQLIKPTRNPKSFDSSEEDDEAKIFSLSEENGYLKYGASNQQEGDISQEFRIEGIDAYDMASNSVQK